MTRKQQREHIFKLLFQSDFINESELSHHLNAYLEALKEDYLVKGKQLKATDLDYIRNKFVAILPLVKELDDTINEKVSGWKTTRMNKGDLSILRLALYEINHDEDIPLSVAINEAVELAKKFSGEEGYAFVNGVLAKLIK